MVIGIDASRAAKPNKTGTEWYSFFLIEELKKITGGAGYKIILYSREPLTCPLGVLPSNWENRILKWPPKYLWTNIRLSWEMLFNPPDVLFIPAHSVPLIHAKHTVVTWHDIGFEKFKHLYSPQAHWYHKWTVRYSLKHATKVIVISEFTKNEILDLFKIPAEKMEVVYNGYDNEKFTNKLENEKVAAVLKKYNISKPYIFYIGRLEEKKNIKGLISSFGEFKKMRLEKESMDAEQSNEISNFQSLDKLGTGFLISNKITNYKLPLGHELKAEWQIINNYKNSNEQNPKIQNLKLVLAGRPGYGYDEVKNAMRKYGVEKDVIELGWTTEEDIPYLLAGAEIFCFLSFYEGFGIPVLEAMACGVPVIASDIPPLREVAMDAAVFADPNDPKKISEAMERILLDSELKTEMVKRGLKRAEMFSWKKCARETLEALMKL